MTKKEKLLKIARYIRLKIRDAKVNVSIIETINLYKTRHDSKYSKHLLEVAWSQNWTLLIINVCTIFERNMSGKVICSLDEMWKILDSYTRFNKNQKRRKEQIVELRNSFNDYKLGVLQKNKNIRNECLAHNDYFKKSKYNISEVESQKELLVYAETYLTLVGEFVGVRIANLSENSKLEKCLYEVLSSE